MCYVTAGLKKSAKMVRRPPINPEELSH